jgi:hypothetical protein
MLSGQKCHCQPEHQNRANYPVLHQG